MSREEYLQLRNSGKIHIGLAWEFYIEKEHEIPKISFDIFQQLFPMYLQMGSIDGYYYHYDSKYGINKLIGLNGEIKYI